MKKITFKIVHFRINILSLKRESRLPLEEFLEVVRCEIL